MGCWAFAVVGAIEAAMAITNGTKSVPILSDTQVLTCVGSGGCNGGWPGDAFEYASQFPILEASKFTTCPGKSVRNDSFPKLSMSIITLCFLPLFVWETWTGGDKLQGGLL